MSNPGARRSVGHRLASVVLPPLVMFALVIGAWYFISYEVLDRRRQFLLEPPHRVLQVGFLRWENFHPILRALWSSTKVAFWGLGIAFVVGVALAVIMSQAKVIERAWFPFMVTLQAIPILAIVPLIGFWWGTGQTSRIIVCVIIAFFPILLNTLFGLQSPPRELHDLFTLKRASRISRLRRLQFPAALPAIFAGLRISAGLSVIGAVVGDFFFARGEVGIGQLLKIYAQDLDGEKLLASVIMTAALGVAVFLTFGWLQNRVIGSWYEGSSTERN